MSVLCIERNAPVAVRIGRLFHGQDGQIRELTFFAQRSHSLGFADFLEVFELRALGNISFEFGTGSLFTTKRSTFAFARREIPLPIEHEYPSLAAKIVSRDVLWIASTHL